MRPAAGNSLRKLQKGSHRQHRCPSCTRGTQHPEHCGAAASGCSATRGRTGQAEAASCLPQAGSKHAGPQGTWPPCSTATARRWLADSVAAARNNAERWQAGRWVQGTVGAAGSHWQQADAQLRHCWPPVCRHTHSGCHLGAQRPPPAGGPAANTGTLHARGLLPLQMERQGGTTAPSESHGIKGRPHGAHNTHTRVVPRAQQNWQQQYQRYQHNTSCTPG